MSSLILALAILVLSWSPTDAMPKNRIVIGPSGITEGQCLGTPCGCLKSDSCDVWIAYNNNPQQFDLMIGGSGVDRDSFIEVQLQHEGGSGGLNFHCASNDPYMTWQFQNTGYTGVTLKKSHSLAIYNKLYCSYEIDIVGADNSSLVAKNYDIRVNSGRDEERLWSFDVRNQTGVMDGGKMQSIEKETVLFQSFEFKIHGSIMIVGVQLLATYGIVIGRFLRRIVCGSTAWLLLHVCFMFMVLTVSWSGCFYVLAEVGWRIFLFKPITVEDVHALLGYITLVLMVIHALFTTCRPGPKESGRYVFAIVHQLMGYTLYFMGMGTIFTALFVNPYDHLHWDGLKIMIAIMLVHIVVFLFFMIIAKLFVMEPCDVEVPTGQKRVANPLLTCNPIFGQGTAPMVASSYVVRPRYVKSSICRGCPRGQRWMYLPSNNSGTTNFNSRRQSLMRVVQNSTKGAGTTYLQPSLLAAQNDSLAERQGVYQEGKIQTNNGGECNKNRIFSIYIALFIPSYSRKLRPFNNADATAAATAYTSPSRRNFAGTRAIITTQR